MLEKEYFEHTTPPTRRTVVATGLVSVLMLLKQKLAFALPPEDQSRDMIDTHDRKLEPINDATDRLVIDWTQRIDRGKEPLIQSMEEILARKIQEIYDQYLQEWQNELDELTDTHENPIIQGESKRDFEGTYRAKSEEIVQKSQALIEILNKSILEPQRFFTGESETLSAALAEAKSITNIEKKVKKLQDISDKLVERIKDGESHLLPDYLYVSSLIRFELQKAIEKEEQTELEAAEREVQTQSRRRFLFGRKKQEEPEEDNFEIDFDTGAIIVAPNRLPTEIQVEEEQYQHPFALLEREPQTLWEVIYYTEIYRTLAEEIKTAFDYYQGLPPETYDLNWQIEEAFQKAEARIQTLPQGFEEWVDQYVLTQIESTFTAQLAGEENDNLPDKSPLIQFAIHNWKELKLPDLSQEIQNLQTELTRKQITAHINPEEVALTERNLQFLTGIQQFIEKLELPHILIEETIHHGEPLNDKCPDIEEAILARGYPRPRRYTRRITSYPASEEILPAIEESMRDHDLILIANSIPGNQTHHITREELGLIFQSTQGQAITVTETSTELTRGCREGDITFIYAYDRNMQPISAEGILMHYAETTNQGSRLFQPLAQAISLTTP